MLLPVDNGFDFGEEVMWDDHSDDDQADINVSPCKPHGLANIFMTISHNKLSGFYTS